MRKFYLIKLSDGSVAPGVCYSGDLPSNALECTEEQYGNYQSWAIDGGSLVAAAPPVVPLKLQAEALLKTQQSYVMQNYAIYGDDTPPEWLTYLKALRAIATGTDTTSTMLPTAPEIA